MNSIVKIIQKRTTNNRSLPVLKPAETPPAAPLRRRLSSPSLQIHPSATSKSLSSAGSSVKRWWDWAWAWILSSKPMFAPVLHVDDEEKHAIGFQNRGSVMHVFFRAKSHLRDLFSFHDDLSLPQTNLRHDPRGHQRPPIFG